MITFANSWLPFIYLYSIGGICFVIGLIVTKRAGAMNLKKKEHRFWLKVLFFGYFYFMFIHFIFIYAALYW